MAGFFPFITFVSSSSIWARPVGYCFFLSASSSSSRDYSLIYTNSSVGPGFDEESEVGTDVCEACYVFCFGFGLSPSDLSICNSKTMISRPSLLYPILYAFVISGKSLTTEAMSLLTSLYKRCKSPSLLEIIV